MANMKCPQCGLTNWATATNCKRCDLNFETGEMPVATHEEGLENSTFERNNSASPHRFQQNNDNYSYNQPKDLKQGMAIASMIMGIVGCFFTAIPGMIMAVSAYKKVNREPFVYGGKGFAIAGMVLNGIQLLVTPVIIAMIAAIAIPNLLASRRSANEASAISSLRTIAAAEATYMTSVGAGNCGDLQQLGQNQLIEVNLANGQKNGYRFNVIKTPSNVYRGSVNCEVTAVPIVENKPGDSTKATGTRSFYQSNEDGWNIRYSSIPGINAKINDPIVGQNTPSQPQISTNPRAQPRNY
jgi:type IV pilus assembly protein PilA